MAPIQSGQRHPIRAEPITQCDKLARHVAVTSGCPMKIQELTISERIILAEALWDSVIDQDACIELTEEQKKELDKRLSAFEVDGDVGSEWSDVRSRILSKP